jgi:hypothetical protein
MTPSNNLSGVRRSVNERFGVVAPTRGHSCWLCRRDSQRRSGGRPGLRIARDPFRPAANGRCRATQSARIFNRVLISLPGATHEYFEVLDSYFPGAGIEYYYYDGRYLYCPNGSHLAIYDDQTVYMTGLIQLIEDVDAGRF